MKRFTLISVLLCAGATVALGATFTGQVSSAAGEVGGLGAWISPGPTTLAWEITDFGSYFHYKYTLTVPPTAPQISHFLIEVSPNFTAADFWNATGPHSVTEIGDFTQANGNPDIPAPVHGLKFDSTTGRTAVFEFDSSRVPVWGDFYAKCGGNPPNQAWNAGLALADPIAPAANGSLDDHILVPDSVTPEPTGLALAGLLLVALRRR